MRVMPMTLNGASLASLMSSYGGWLSSPPFSSINTYNVFCQQTRSQASATFQSKPLAKRRSRLSMVVTFSRQVHRANTSLTRTNYGFVRALVADPCLNKSLPCELRNTSHLMMGARASKSIQFRSGQGTATGGWQCYVRTASR